MRGLDEAVGRISLKPSAVKGTGNLQGSGERIRRMRERHHVVAKMFALGFDYQKISDTTGWSVNQLRLLKEQTPAFQELILYYERERGRMDEVLDEYVDLVRKNMLMAEQLLAERLNEDGETLSTGDLLKIGRDAADRLGYGKRSTHLHINADMAAKLERARSRSGRATALGDGTAGVGPVIDAVALPAPKETSLPPSAPDLSAPPVEERTVFIVGRQPPKVADFKNSEWKPPTRPPGFGNTGQNAARKALAAHQKQV